MRYEGYDLVHFNFAIAKWPLDDPEMAGFTSQLETVNRLAAESPGFVWTPADGEAGDAVATFGEPRVLANMSTWHSLDELRQFTYEGRHGLALQQRRDWFDAAHGPAYVLWWAPAGTRPDWTEARQRLEHLRNYGPTPEAFTFTKAFGPRGEPIKAGPTRVNPFDAIKARLLLFWLAATLVAGTVATLIVWPDYGLYSSPTPDAVLGLLTSALLFAITAGHVRLKGLGVADFFGKIPSAHTRDLAVLALPMIGVALITTYIVWVPLSFVVPDFTKAWILDSALILYSADSPYPWVGNVLGVISAVIVVPFAEEWFFRGLLLRRWSRKWSTMTGVIASSMVFALLHPDFLGAFVFSVVMCWLYGRYHTLWAPVFVHVSNNAITWGLSVVDAHTGGPLTLVTLAEFRAAWWMPGAGLLLVLPFMGQIRREWTPIKSWQFSADRA